MNLKQLAEQSNGRIIIAHIGDSTKTTNTMRPIHEIANEISRAWNKPYFGAVPYLRAMQSIESIDQNYGADSAKSIILYFLANASTWRGETARRIKKELNQLIK